MKRALAIIMTAIVVVLACATTGCAQEQEYSVKYGISRLASNGGVLWSIREVNKDASLAGSYIVPEHCTGHMTVRVYDTFNRGTRIADYMNVYTTTRRRQTPFYPEYRNDYYRCVMKFSNDTATSIASSGDWGLTSSESVINN